MENSNLRPFVSELWIKTKDETLSKFQNNVNERVNILSQYGYTVGLTWLNLDGEECREDREYKQSTMCRITERKIEKNKSEWLEEQSQKVKRMEASSKK